MRRVIASSLMFVAMAFMAERAWAQATGSIAGIVRDTTGAVLPGVTVEAASPALIEKVRVAVTDDQGNYKITDLRPGVYSVTFTLTGFAAYRREGLELTTGFTATANAEMKVGSLEETVTVTGASPIVDVQNVRNQVVISAALLDALPVTKTIVGFAAMTLGATEQVTGGSPHDVGGNKGENSQSLGRHGSRSADMRRSIDGMSFNSLSASGGGLGALFRADMAGIQETVLETASNAESETGGVQLNYVPKDGGNQLSLYFATSYTNEHFAADNVTDELRARGLPDSTISVRKIYDVGVGVGGAIRKDRLWFYGTARRWTAQEYQPGAFHNATLGTLFFTPDLSRPIYTDFPTTDFGGRFTWQAATKHKVTASMNTQLSCLCNRASAVVALEAQSQFWFRWPKLIQATWTHPATNRLLFQAGTSFGLFVREHQPLDGVLPSSIAVTELSTGLRYGALANANASSGAYGKSDNFNINQRVSMSYVTGSHALKTGIYTMQGVDNSAPEVLNDISYTFRNQVPTSLTLWATPGISRLRVRGLGLYAQDQWTIKRLTLNMGVRYDAFNGYTLRDELPERRYAPAVVFEPVKDVPDFKDISPRLGAAYDLFGTGRTAVKVSLGRYVHTLGADPYTNVVHPFMALAVNTNRTWNDVNRNYVPDCNLRIPTANGECGPFANAAFGTLRPSAQLADDAIRGWSNRPYNWQTQLNLQHELRPGFSINAGYFRTWYGNINTIQNRAVTAANFDPYCVTVPVDSRLPGSGQQICGLYDVNPSRFGQVDDITTQASNFANYTEIYNGFEIGFTGRFGRSGAFLSGGVSAGQTATNICDFATLPQMRFVPSPGGAPIPPAREGFCDVTPPWSAGAQLKLTGVQPLPGGFAFGFNYQNLGGVPVGANLTYTNAQIAPSLGRNLSGGANATATIQIVPSQTMFEDRLSQLDLRVSRNFRFGRTKVQGQLEAYNVFNSATVLSVNQTYGPAWLRPTGIMGARMFKFGVQFDY